MKSEINKIKTKSSDEPKVQMGWSEKQAFVGLIISGLILWHFCGRMFDGFSVVDHSAADLWWIYIRVTLSYIVLHIIAAILFAIGRRKNLEDGDVFETDERDDRFTVKAERVGFWVLVTAVEIVIVMLLLENAYPESYIPPISVLSTSAMFAALFGAVMVADIARHITLIVLYRR